ncbi:hypothetical protein [Methylophilus sp. DW102]|uniref:hypothetical protein n=1 Tax=Methylophilus sp. DW102 TaxID=3095607 RepID=UPI00308DF144|nr:lysis protein [Methylophilus sp. DW102]
MSVIPTWFKALVIGALIGLILHKTYQAGAETERSKWLLKTALQTVSNQVAQAKKDRALRVLENRIASQAVEISTFYQGVMDENLKRKDSIIARLNNRTLRLSVPVSGPAATCQGAGSVSTSNQPQAAGETRAELSDSAAQFLVGIGAECDAEVIHANEVKDHLAACRAALEQQQFILKE